MERVNLRLYQEPQDSGPSASGDVFSLCGAKAALRRLSFNFWIISRFPWLVHREKGDAMRAEEEGRRTGKECGSKSNSHEITLSGILFSRILSTRHGPVRRQTHSPGAHKARGPQEQVLRRLRESESPMGILEVRAVHSLCLSLS